MARVAMWVTLQVVLMFGLGFPEGTGCGDLRHHLARPKTRGFDVGDRVDGNPLLILRRVENRRTVTGSPIISLAVQRGGIVDLEKELQQLPVAELLRVKNDLNRLCM